LSSKNDIAEIIAGCRKGEALYQRALVDNYSELLFSVALRYMGDESRAKDVLQETFIRVFKSFKTFDPNKGSISTWMRKITVNVALRSLSKKHLKTSTLTIEFNEKYSTAPEILQKMEHDDIMAVVQSLPEGYRQVFNLAVIEGYSHKEIGEMLGLEEVSSRSKLSRAKQLLRKKLLASKNSDSWIKTV